MESPSPSGPSNGSNTPSHPKGASGRGRGRGRGWHNGAAPLAQRRWAVRDSPGDHPVDQNAGGSLFDRLGSPPASQDAPSAQGNPHIMQDSPLPSHTPLRPPRRQRGPPQDMQQDKDVDQQRRGNRRQGRGMNRTGPAGSVVGTAVPAAPGQYTEPTSQDPPDPPPTVPYTALLGDAEPSALCQAILQQLRTGYECMVCCSDLRRSAAVWSCGNCYKLFHLSCMRRWGKGREQQFRCPQCQKEYDNVPARYTCYCSKTTDPPIDAHFVPHSCGNLCARTARGNPLCDHPCPLRCHPGPCPKCEQPFTVTCFCGQSTESVPCSIVEGPFRCGKVCARPLSCGSHVCERDCHDGPCAPCPVQHSQACHCGADQRLQRCGDDSPWSCHHPCSRPLECGSHSCSQPCHPGPCGPCPARPQVVTTCPCGKKALYMLTPVARKQCSDPIPTCNQICGKPKPCGVPGHVCKLKCHEGRCEDCEELAPVPCRCGATTGQLPCALLQQLRDETEPVTVAFEGKEYTYPLLCKQKCTANKNCGRHKCTEACCPVRRKGADDPQGLHLCTVRCGKRLACNRHTCEERCHRGACPPCMYIVTEEMHCPCGLTVLEPPQPCGTQLPNCTEPCRRERPCGHPNIAHMCHNGECPPCTAIVEKQCVGNHGLVSNVPCHLQARCKQMCGRPLACGKHTCSERCHAGPCAATCQAPCGNHLPCGHSCGLACHQGHCPEYCKREVTIACPCGRRTEQVPCKQYQHMLRLAADKRGSVPLEQMPQLACDKECEGDKRLQGLAAALGVKEDRVGGAFHTTLYTPALYWNTHKSPLLRTELKLLEGILREFVASGKPTHLVQTPSRERRELLIDILPYYHIDHDSLEVPARTVFLRRTPQTKIPDPTLGELLQRGDYDPNQAGQQRLEKYPGAGLVLDRLNTTVTERTIVDYLKPWAGKYTLLWQSDQMCIAVFMTAQMREEAAQALVKGRWPYGATPFNETLYPALYGPDRRGGAGSGPADAPRKGKRRTEEPDEDGWAQPARAAPSAPAPQRHVLSHSKGQFGALIED